MGDAENPPDDILVNVCRLCVVVSTVCAMLSAHKQRESGAWDLQDRLESK